MKTKGERTMTDTVVAHIARTLDAAQRCRAVADGTVPPIARVVDEQGTDITRRHWDGMALMHRDTLNALCDTMPSGSGWDHGTKLDLERSTPQRLVFHGAYHHTDENGSYDGWSTYEIVVTPCLMFGISMRVVGRNRNDVKTYLHEVFEDALMRRPSGVESD